jgi:hypothetical protein
LAAVKSRCQVPAFGCGKGIVIAGHAIGFVTVTPPEASSPAE